MNWVSSGHGTDIDNEHGKLTNAASMKYTKKKNPQILQSQSEYVETTNFKFEENFSKGGNGTKRISNERTSGSEVKRS